VSWPEVVAGARMLRGALQALGLESFVKTTGGRGLHLVVPIAAERPWDECLAFTRALTAAIARRDPGRYTVANPKAGREKKILLDYLRNNRTNTSVAAYSTRAHPDGTVSVPVTWEELTARLRPEELTLVTVPRRLARLRADPWAGYWKSRQRLTDQMIDAVDALD
jgi:bifunctional non-homologous end joining protein LigD